jgi:hypothetical protein
VDQRKDELIVASYSKTKPGFWVMNGWLRRVPAESSDDDLGVLISNALDASETGIEAPTRDANPAKPLLEMVGLRSYGAYMEGTRSLSVSRDGEGVTVEPSRNEGRRGGFTPLPARSEQLNRPSAPELAKAVREALGRTI